MKKIALSLIAMMVAMFSFAQQVLVATLTHDGETTMFYGVEAFAKAHEAAENGDIINLSPGNFDPTTITKAVTIRGTGIDEPNHTFIMNETYVSIPEDTEDYLDIEGCEFNSLNVRSHLNNVRFSKTIIRELDTDNHYYVYYELNNCTFINCKITGRMRISNENSSVSFFNCYIRNLETAFNSNTNILNCVLRKSYDNSFSNYISATIANTIIYEEENQPIDYTLRSVLSNCVAISYRNEEAFSHASSVQNCKVVDFDIFKDSDLLNDLTDDAKSQYLGLDGTPVGMYGGAYPFNTTPSYPRITNFVVDGKVNDEGKLKVNIEVTNPE